jgi:hypothetical protein
VDLAHVGDDLAAGRALDNRRELVLHGLLEVTPDLVHRVPVSVLDQGPLDRGEAIPEDADHHVVDHVRLGLGRPLAVELAMKLHESGRDRGEDLAAVTRLLNVLQVPLCRTGGVHPVLPAPLWTPPLTTRV